MDASTAPTAADTPTRKERALQRAPWLREVPPVKWAEVMARPKGQRALRPGERLEHPRWGVVTVQPWPCPECGQAGVKAAGTLVTEDGRQVCQVHGAYTGPAGEPLAAR